MYKHAIIRLMGIKIKKMFLKIKKIAPKFGHFKKSAYLCTVQ